MVLYRLLVDLPGDGYCLISREYYGKQQHSRGYTRRLPGRYYHLKPVFQLPLINRFNLYAFSLTVNTPWTISRRAAQISKILRREKCDVLIACSGDLYDLPAACLASRLTGVHLVLYLFDDYTYQWTGLYRLFSKPIERYTIKYAKAVILPNEYMQEAYRTRYGARSTIIRNPARVPDLDSLDRAERVFSDKETNIVYTGAVYHAHYDAFQNLIGALRRLNKKDVKLHIYTAQPEEELRRNGIEGAMVVYHPHIEESMVPKVLRHADILFLPLSFNSTIREVIRTSAPGKTGEYLASGRPILVHAPRDSFVSWFFRKEGCGLVVDRSDQELLAQEIAMLISDEGVRSELGGVARKVAESEFGVERIRKKFSELINSL